MTGNAELRLVALPTPVGAVSLDERHGVLPPRYAELIWKSIIKTLVVALHTEVRVLAERRRLGIMAAATNLEGARIQTIGCCSSRTDSSKEWGA